MMDTSSSSHDDKESILTLDGLDTISSTTAFEDSSDRSDTSALCGGSIAVETPNVVYFVVAYKILIR